MSLEKKNSLNVLLSIMQLLLKYRESHFLHISQMQLARIEDEINSAI